MGRTRGWVPKFATLKSPFYYLHFLAIFLALSQISFTKLRFRRSFWDAEWVCNPIGSIVMAWNAKISVSGFYWFCKKKMVNIKKDFLSFMLQLRGLLWMMTCTEKRPYLRKKSKFSILVMTCCQIRPKQNKNKHSNNSRNLVFTRLQSIDGSYGESKWITKPQKIWNELIFMFVIYSCQKIEYKCIFCSDI